MSKSSGIFSINIEKETKKNKNYRKVLYTDKYQQLVVMSLNPREDIPFETHTGVQYIKIESGKGFIKQDFGNGKIVKTQLKDGISIVIPFKAGHYITNIDKKIPLKLYSVYSPPQHCHGTIDKRQPDGIM
jgi:mannose-6-phosphate isomerase-like protein (cupin superfamily)